MSFLKKFTIQDTILSPLKKNVKIQLGVSNLIHMYIFFTNYFIVKILEFYAR